MTTAIPGPGAACLQAIIRRAAQEPRVTAARAGDVASDFPEVTLWLESDSFFLARLLGWLGPPAESVYAVGTADGAELVTTDGLTILIRLSRPLASTQSAVAGTDPPIPAQETEQDGDSRMQEAVNQFWYHLYRSGAAIGRRHALTAHGLLEPSRIGLIELFRLALSPSTAGAGWQGGDLISGAQALEDVKSWLVCPLNTHAQLRCARKLGITYERLLLPLAERLSLSYPWALRNLAFGRLEAVATAMAAAGHEEVPPAIVDARHDDPQPVGPGRFRIKSRRLSGEQ